VIYYTGVSIGRSPGERGALPGGDGFRISAYTSGWRQIGERNLNGGRFGLAININGSCRYGVWPFGKVNFCRITTINYCCLDTVYSNIRIKAYSTCYGYR